MQRYTDDAAPLSGMFDAVFACRSGGWVPAWCDHRWQEFIGAFPGRPVSVDPDLRPRWTHGPFPTGMVASPR
jgi:hypothetical protein